MAYNPDNIWNLKSRERTGSETAASIFGAIVGVLFIILASTYSYGESTILSIIFWFYAIFWPSMLILSVMASTIYTFIGNSHFRNSWYEKGIVKPSIFEYIIRILILTGAVLAMYSLSPFVAAFGVVLIFVGISSFISRYIQI